MGEVYRKDIPIIAPEFQVANKSGVTRTKREGTVVREIAVATFNPSANTAQRPIAAYGLGVYLPTKAIITNVFVDVVTTFTSASADTGTTRLMYRQPMTSWPQLLSTTHPMSG